MGEAAFDEIEANTLRYEVRDMIRRAIVAGKLVPGEHLKEAAIAEQMAVSRSPVREALRDLEQEGLVSSVPNKGSFVSDLDEHDVMEVFKLRAALESLACELALQGGRIQPADLDYLESLIDEQRAAVNAADIDRLTELDIRFHEFICQKSGFGRLLTMWRSLRAQCEVLFHKRFRTMPNYVPKTVPVDHSALLDALRDRDVDRCAQLNREINERVASECIEILRGAARGQGSRI